MESKTSGKRREPKLLRVSAGADELGLHPLTVGRWIKAGRLQAVQVGLEARIPRTEIERFVGKIDHRLLVLYGSFSGNVQKADLDIQLKRLQARAGTNRKRVQALVLSRLGRARKAGR